MEQKRPSYKNLSKYAGRYFPARPKQILKSARKLASVEVKIPKGIGLPLASNPAYINWLKSQSMLGSAKRQAKKFSGSSMMWQKPYARPSPRSAIKQASVWYTAYPLSMITRPKDSILASFGDPELWKAFSEIGIKAVHTGPMKKAGGIKGWSYTPSIDGHFDRISNNLDAFFGTASEFRHMRDVANQHGGIIIDDIVPGHTGKGADFRLAEMGYDDYPGIYHMVQIDRSDWHLLPDVPRGKDSVNLDESTEEKLKQKGYIIGKLHRVIFYEKGVKETNWSVTKAVRGVDGTKRRWVYLHYFKDGQPSINWLDPSFAGMKLVVGDAMHSIEDLGASGLRLDANGFLGIERSHDDDAAWSEGHPLSEAANHLISSMVRKLGGFTFQELNLSIDDIKTMAEDGADLSYDFITRPAYHHALATGDAEFLRLMTNLALEQGIDPASMVHALQNHDEMTYELVHFWTVHKNDDFPFRGQDMKGSDLREDIIKDLKKAYLGGNSSNLPFTQNGIAGTNASLIAALLGFDVANGLDAQQIEQIKNLHLLLAAYNALQPGVFALSGWDLSGSLALSRDQVGDLLETGDTRWINRGAYDLMNANTSANQSVAGIAKANNLYGTLPEQLEDPGSFARRLADILKVREQFGIATAHLLEVPNVKNKGLYLAIHRLDNNDLQLTVINFSEQALSEVVESDHLPNKFVVSNMLDGSKADKPTSKLTLALEPYSFGSILLREA